MIQTLRLRRTQGHGNDDADYYYMKQVYPETGSGKRLIILVHATDLRGYLFPDPQFLIQTYFNRDGDIAVALWNPNDAYHVQPDPSNYDLVIGNKDARAKFPLAKALR